jgi:DNA-binding CsgD family transcriptional regulator
MTLFRVLYWGLSYSVGLVCVTILFLRYIQARDKVALKLLAYLLPFGVSLASLSLLEAFSVTAFLGRTLGQVALAGAALVIATFPAYALVFDDLKSRRRLAFIMKVVGVTLAAIDLFCIFTPDPIRSGFHFLTLACLGVAIFVGMTWITRGEVHHKKKHHWAWMTSLFVFFGLVFFLDFFRDFIPGLNFADWRYVILPAFYAYLNIFIIYSHITQWAPRIEQKDKVVSEPAVESLKRFGVSSRETEVLSHLARGRTYGEIADVLCVSLATIKTHLSHLYEKTGTRNKVELINLLYDSIESPQNQPNAR